jgi:hypothetical protein
VRARLVFCVVLCAGCTVEGVQGDSGKEPAAVLNGTDSGPEEDGVVHIYSTKPMVLHRCSGTLVAKNLVATAQHCVSNFEDGNFDCTPEGRLDPGSVGGEMGALIEPANVEIRVGAHADVRVPPAALGSRIFAPTTTTICNNDVAFVVLDRDIEGVSPYPIRLTSSVLPSDIVRVLGYGVTEAMESADVRYSRDGLRVALVGDNEFRPEGESLAPRAFLTQGPALCPGDSGGPAFAESGALVGVFSLVVGGACDSTRARNVFTQVSPFHASVIGPAFEAAGATPIVEPPGAGGSAGSASTSGGEAGEGGSPGLAGSGGTGGTTAAGTGGLGGGAGSSGDAGSAGEAPDRRGLRQPGGCRCALPGGAGERAPLGMSAALGALGLAVLRRLRGRPRLRRLSRPLTPPCGVRRGGGA